jgi:hypothetical protein
VYILTTYSMGLRLGETLKLTIGDITYMDVGKGREVICQTNVVLRLSRALP